MNVARATRRLSAVSRSFSMSASSARPPRPSFPLTPPPPHPLGPGKHVKTAGCIIIGDEVLNGKTNDTNSNFLAKLLFDVGVDLKRIEVIPDEEEEIVEAARRMVDKYDFVCASGGIGPTHDDITCPFRLPSTMRNR